MANEQSVAAYITATSLLQSYLSGRIHETLRDPADLRRAMTFYPWEGGRGAPSMVIPKISMAAAMSAASSEISGGFSNSAVSTSSVSLTPARYGRVIQATDFFRLVAGDGNGNIDIQRLLDILVGSLGQTMTDLLCAAFPNLATVVGNAGARLDVDTFYDGAFALNLNNNAGNLKAILHNIQVNHLQESIRGELGTLANTAQTQAAVEAIRMAPGFRFMFAGVEVWQSDSVGLDGGTTERIGAMLSEGCYGYTLANIADMDPNIDPADIVRVGAEGDPLVFPNCFVERSRDPINGMTSYVVNAYPAVTEIEDLRGVRIETLAS